MAKRVVLIVLDSVGIGSLPDAHLFGDEGADTVGHIIQQRGLNVPSLAQLGLYKIAGTSFFGKQQTEIIGSYGKCAEKSQAKDTTSGHWEIAGYIREQPFRTFPNGFPDDLIQCFTEKTGYQVLGNEVASGTEIIKRLGAEHVATGKPIVYTSADSVFQIAAHEEVIPLPELYRICEAAREMLDGDWAVGRVIARPFIGTEGAYQRTENRRDYAVAPEQDTMLDAISRSGQRVYGIGKIEDIFYHRGLTQSLHTSNNADGIQATIEAVRTPSDGLIFTNLVDFDMLYGHRNDVEGYGRAIEYFDSYVPVLLDALQDEDMLIITADHGCDPAFPGTDHTREYIPLLVYGKKLKKDINLGIRESFTDIAASVVDYLGLERWPIGQSFIQKLM